MSALVYWQERLEEGRAFYAMDTMTEGFDFRLGERKGYWPDSISRVSLYGNYSKWAADRRFVPDESRAFYLAMAPLLYIRGTEYKYQFQIRNYKPRVQRWARGRWVWVRISRYFVVLFSHAEHMEAFVRVHPDLDKYSRGVV